MMGVPSLMNPSSDFTSTSQSAILALPMRARRVVATPVSPAFTESCDGVAEVEEMVLWSDMRSSVFEWANHQKKSRTMAVETKTARMAACVPYSW